MGTRAFFFTEDSSASKSRQNSDSSSLKYTPRKKSTQKQQQHANCGASLFPLSPLPRASCDGSAPLHQGVRSGRGGARRRRHHHGEAAVQQARRDGQTQRAKSHEQHGLQRSSLRVGSVRTAAQTFGGDRCRRLRRHPATNMIRLGRCAAKGGTMGGVGGRRDGAILGGAAGRRRGLRPRARWPTGRVTVRSFATPICAVRHGRRG